MIFLLSQNIFGGLCPVGFAFYSAPGLFAGHGPCFSPFVRLGGGLGQTEFLQEKVSPHVVDQVHHPNLGPRARDPHSADQFSAKRVFLIAKNMLDARPDLRTFFIDPQPGGRQGPVAISFIMDFIFEL